MPTDTSKTQVIAHRGASGYLPEHTAEAKVLAHWQGADYLEQDVVATRDGALIVFHDIYLESVTDVEALYPGRNREDGRYYVVDFDLAEIRELTVNVRGDREGEIETVYPEGFPTPSERFRIPTLSEEIDLIQELNRLTGRDTGLYPELKNPAWHHRHGIDLAGRVLETLSATGYQRHDDAVFVQCFDHDEVRRLKEDLATPLKLVQLVGDDEAYSSLLSPEGLAAAAELVDGLAPSYTQLAVVGDDAVVRPSNLFEQARDAGLELHPYTFRRRNLPPYAGSLETLLEIFFRDIPVDAVFCDYPDVAVLVRASMDG